MFGVLTTLWYVGTPIMIFSCNVFYHNSPRRDGKINLTNSNNFRIVFLYIYNVAIDASQPKYASHLPIYGRGGFMKCFTVSPGLLVAGICGVDGTHPVDMCVCLGDCTENGHLSLLPVFPKNPPDIFSEGDGVFKILDAHPVQPKGCEHFTLAKPCNVLDQRILVRVTHCEATIKLGSSVEVGFGFGVGDKDVLSTCWYDSVRILTPGTALFLRVQRNEIMETHVLVAGRGEAKLLTLKEFIAKVREDEEAHTSTPEQTTQYLLQCGYPFD